MPPPPQVVFNMEVLSLANERDDLLDRLTARGEVLKAAISLGFRPFPPMKWISSPQRDL